MPTPRLAVLLGLAIVPIFGWGQLPNHTPIPGGIATVVLGPAGTPKPTAHFGRHAVMVTQDKGRWVSIVGLGLDVVPGRYILKTTDQDHVTNAHEFTVRAHRYRVTQVAPIVKKVRGKRAAPIILSDMTYDPRVYALPQQPVETIPELPLRLPVDGVEPNDRFGEREVGPEETSQPIRYLEFTVSSERAVLAPGAGRIAGVLSLAAGDMLVIDHGRGLLSLLWPLSAVPVKVNEDVARGAQLGRPILQPESDTGQLRWSVALNAEFVNPRLLIGVAAVTVSRQTVSR